MKMKYYIKLASSERVGRYFSSERSAAEHGDSLTEPFSIVKTAARRARVVRKGHYVKFIGSSADKPSYVYRTTRDTISVRSGSKSERFTSKIAGLLLVQPN